MKRTTKLTKSKQNLKREMQEMSINQFVDPIRSQELDSQSARKIHDLEQQQEEKEKMMMMKQQVRRHQKRQRKSAKEKVREVRKMKRQKKERRIPSRDRPLEENARIGRARKRARKDDAADASLQWQRFSSASEINSTQKSCDFDKSHERKKQQKTKRKLKKATKRRGRKMLQDSPCCHSAEG